MKKLTFTLSLLLVLLTGCSGAGKKKIELPPLEDGQTICLENEDVRLLDHETDNTFYIVVQSKYKDGKSFETPEGTIFETIMGNSLVVSQGTGNIRTLLVYNLQTGEEKARIENFFSGIAPVPEGDSAMTFYIYNEDTAGMAWDASLEEWILYGDLEEGMQNATIEEAKRSCEEHLFPGLCIVPLQKHRMDLASCTVTSLKEYRWNYSE
ncbi:hypothetical protein HQ29_01780 [Porphyromonas canoris]|uniref:hypothetical protein n=1 Tax=Porphyromonas canoris TaxID=36875 RepID=UPI00051D800D|nr:hypothetical protein [Porphyromonas canoris]KGL53330.1 hypothetical protein HQ29_01780 [Porphyromonas canoris]